MTTRFLATSLILSASLAYVVMADDPTWVGSDANGPLLDRKAATRIEGALRESSECSFTDTPLEEALNFFEDQHHIEIWMDKQALQDEGVATDQQVTLVMTGISLKSALHLILDPLSLTHHTEDGVLKITTQAKADEIMTTRVYPVADLIERRGENFNFMTLMNTIQNCTSGKWIDVDQEGGALSPFPNAESLVVRQTEKVHREVEGLFAALRKAKQLQKISSIPVRDDSPETLNPIEPALETQRPTMRSPRKTQTWQRPRVHHE